MYNLQYKHIKNMEANTNPFIKKYTVLKKTVAVKIVKGTHASMY